VKARALANEVQMSLIAELEHRTNAMEVINASLITSVPFSAFSDRAAKLCKGKP